MLRAVLPALAARATPTERPARPPLSARVPAAAMACFTFAPLRAALPAVARPAPQPRAALPAFSGLRASSSLPPALAGAAGGANAWWRGPA